MKSGMRFLLPVLALSIMLSCSSNDSTDSSVTIDFDTNNIDTGLNLPQQAVVGETIPLDVSYIDVLVYQGSVDVKNVIAKKVFNRAQVAKTNSISLEVPAGKDRIILVTAKDNKGTPISQGQAGPMELVAQKAISVVILMNRLYTTQNATLTINLLNDNGTPFTNPGYLTGTNPIRVDVYRPTIVAGEFELGATLGTTNSPYSTTVSGVTAFPYTYQMLVVRAITRDGTIALFGGTSIGYLNPGNNTINIYMYRPGRIVIANATPVTNVQVQIWMFGTGTWHDVTTTGYISGNSVFVQTPNALPNIGVGQTPQNIRIQYRVNYTITSPFIQKDYIAGTNTLDWSVLTLP